MLSRPRSCLWQRESVYAVGLHWPYITTLIWHRFYLTAEKPGTQSDLFILLLKNDPCVHTVNGDSGIQYQE